MSTLKDFQFRVGEIFSKIDFTVVIQTLRRCGAAAALRELRKNNLKLEVGNGNGIHSYYKQLIPFNDSNSFESMGYICCVPIIFQNNRMGENLGVIFVQERHHHQNAPYVNRNKLFQ